MVEMTKEERALRIQAFIFNVGRLLGTKKGSLTDIMQMHSGEIDISRLGAFAEQNGNVDEFQVLEFLNIDGAQIIIGKNSLANSVQDNGLCTQSKRFDYLLDLDGKVIKVSPGEIYIPISYMKDGSAKVGEQVVICGKEFTVAGFLRDSQMNSLLASSKRFLVNKNARNRNIIYGDNRLSRNG